MNKKVIVTTESMVMAVKEMLDKKDAWDHFDVVVVRDEDYPDAVTHLKETLPKGRRIREVPLKEK